MPIPAKPCEGRFSDEVLDAISKNRDRAQWANHTCEVCGLSIGATQEKGRWVPEQHWPSVKYHARTAPEKKHSRVAATLEPEDSGVLAESTSR
jgi:hypothetical protein